MAKSTPKPTAKTAKARPSAKAATKPAARKAPAGGGLQVRSARPGKLSAPTAYQSNPSGQLKVSRNPTGSGTYNPQLGQPPIQASYTSAPRGK